jgi:alpha-tubulin suppressor-like RCC1 family protein
MKKTFLYCFLIVTLQTYSQCWKMVSGQSASQNGIRLDGTLWGWGYNANGEIGDGTFTYKDHPVQLVLPPIGKL